MQPMRAALSVSLTLFVFAFHSIAFAADRPNILLAISDDQSYPHASAYGAKGLSTPGFDRVAKEGVLFQQAFAASPGCSPSRAALLTGRHTWQLENAGTHGSSFPTKYVTFPDLLEQAGYHVGYTGKGWGPGNWKISGRERNPAGPVYAEKKTKAPHSGISNTDYAANFREFLEARDDGQPFCFWFGGHEPHRLYDPTLDDTWQAKLQQIEVPPFLPDTPEVRADMLTYFREIEWFDKHLAAMLDELERRGELENTLVIVTSDNGMSFPRAKANCYEYGAHVPLAICWGAKANKGRSVDDLVGFVDLTATILDAAGVQHPGASDPATKPAGTSLLPILCGEGDGLIDSDRRFVYFARERHSSARYKNLGYPQRAIRSQDYLYIRNFKPERWPAGAPQLLDDNDQLGPPHGAYHDIDPSPTLTFLVEKREDPAISKFFHLAVDKRPREELYNVREDPGCLVNLVDSPAHHPILTKLRSTLQTYLEQTGDPRVGPEADIFETYERYNTVRKFPPPGE